MYAQKTLAMGRLHEGKSTYTEKLGVKAGVGESACSKGTFFWEHTVH